MMIWVEGEKWKMIAHHGLSIATAGYQQALANDSTLYDLRNQILVKSNFVLLISDIYKASLLIFARSEHYCAFGPCYIPGNRSFKDVE